MTNPHPPFAKLLVADDGEQVVFMVDFMNGMERLQAVTQNVERALIVHAISFDMPGMAYQMLDAMGPQQAEIMRRMALHGGSGNAELVESVRMLQ